MRDFLKTRTFCKTAQQVQEGKFVEERDRESGGQRENANKRMGCRVTELKEDGGGARTGPKIRNASKANRLRQTRERKMVVAYNCLLANEGYQKPDCCLDGTPLTNDALDFHESPVISTEMGMPWYMQFMPANTPPPP